MFTQPKVSQGSGENGWQEKKDVGFGNFDYLLSFLIQPVSQGSGEDDHVEDAEVGCRRTS